MELSATQEIIAKLKKVKEEQSLSVPQIKAMVDATGTYLSLTTLRRVFAEGSEKDNSFSYENTLRPIAQAMLIADGLTDADALVRAKTETFEAIIRHKNEVIESLQMQIEAMKEDREKRGFEYEDRMNFLRNQIDLKDKRMERKDTIIAKLLDKII